jgi:hypothetical protein
MIVLALLIGLTAGTGVVLGNKMWEAHLKLSSPDTGPRIIERERIVIDRTETNRGLTMWYVVKESPAHNTDQSAKTEIWATTNFHHLLTIKENKYRRIFFTSVLAHNSESARKESEKCKSWKELCRK